MKICWDNLENIRLNRNGNFYMIGTTHTYIYYDSCLLCKDPFLGFKDSTYCSLFCAGRSEEHRLNIGRSNTGKVRSQECRDNAKKNSKSLPGEKSYNWKGGYRAKNIPRYDNYVQQLEPYEECRRDPNDYNVLQVKCTYCGKWYTPKETLVLRRIYGIRNYDTNRFYCLDTCKQECPMFGRTKSYKGQENQNAREVQPQLRQLVFARDNWICQRCGSQCSLHCHHIDPVKSNPIESADADVCITLCKECHKLVHKNIPGCGYNELTKC